MNDYGYNYVLADDVTVLKRCLDIDPTDDVVIVRRPRPLPPPERGTHESDLPSRIWGPIIEGLPGTDADETWYRARSWSRRRD
jgi:hypothetical protein